MRPPDASTSAALFLPLREHAGGSVLNDGQFLSPNEYLRSSNGNYFALMAKNGDLSVYPGPVWRSGNRAETDLSPSFAILQNDGNLCVYRGKGPGDNKGVSWACSKAALAAGDYFAIMQDDGNLCVYRGRGPGNNKGHVWSSGPDKNPVKTIDDASIERYPDFLKPFLIKKVQDILAGGPPTTPEKSQSSGTIANFKQAFEDLTKSENSVKLDLLPFLDRTIVVLGIENPRPEFKLGSLAILGDLRLNLSSSIRIKLNLRMSVPLSLEKIKSQGISLAATIPGEWKNAMGIPGLTLKNMTFAGGIGGTAPYLGIKGILDVGLSSPIEMSGAFSPNSPFGVAGMSGKFNELTLKDLVNIQTFLFRAAMNKTGVALPFPDLPIDFIKIKDVDFMIAQISDAALGMEANSARLQGNLNLGGMTLGKIEARFNPMRGFSAFGMISKLNLGPITVTGAGPDGSIGNGDDCPTFFMEYEINPSTAGLIKQKYLISGQVKILGVYLDYLQELRGKKMVIQIVGKLGPVLSVSLEGETSVGPLGALGGIALNGRVHGMYLNEVQDKVMWAINSVPGVREVVSFLKGGIFRIDNIRLSGSLNDFARGVVPGFNIDCAIVGQGVTIPIPSLDLSKTPDITMMVVDVLKKEVIDRVGSLAEQFGRIMKETFTKFGNDVAKEAIKAAEEVKKVAELAAKEITNAANEIGNFGKDAGNKLKDVGEAALKGFVDVVNEIASFFGF